MNKAKHLLDVNVLMALADRDHRHHQTVLEWFDTPGLAWGICAFTEAGFLRIATNPNAGAHSVEAAVEILSEFAERPGYRYWPITASWASLVAPFRDRVFGHQQITDALLLGLAIQQDGVLVTLDRAIRTLAGLQLGRHVLVLE